MLKKSREKKRLLLSKKSRSNMGIQRLGRTAFAIAFAIHLAYLIR